MQRLLKIKQRLILCESFIQVFYYYESNLFKFCLLLNYEFNFCVILLICTIEVKFKEL